MKLYYSPGACSMSPHIVLAEAGVPAELVKVSLKSHKLEDGSDFYAINPKGSVPVLHLDDGSVLTEGPAIVQYIADKAPQSKLVPPAGSMERYRVQEWLNYITSEIHKTYSVLFDHTGLVTDELKAATREKLANRFKWVASTLGSKPYLTGEDFTAADAYLFTMLTWHDWTGVDISPLQAYFDRVKARPTRCRVHAAPRDTRRTNMNAFPTIFVSHGSPMHALEAGPSGEAWAAIAAKLPRPESVLIASAHWDTAVPMLTGADRLQTIHDFHGFPEALYRVRYDAPGAPQTAQRASALLKDAGIAAGIDGCRGIDHGAWVPLRFMYPGADIPVAQLSVQTARGTAHHWELGRALAPLAEQGVLVIGSGHATHNLRDWRPGHRGGNGEAAPMPYAAHFADWLAERIAAGDARAVADYRDLEPDGARAHPTEEHFVPLLFAWGAAAPDARPERFHRGIEGSALAMDAYAFWPK